MAPTTMKVVKSVAKGKAEIQDVPIPKLRDDYVLVKTTAVALNPTDWKHVHYLAVPGNTVGCDFSGVVDEVGPKVTKHLKKGDRICGLVHGINRIEPEDGAFGEYVVNKGDINIKLPDNITDEEGATLPVGIATCGQGLYQSLGVPLPGQGKAGYPILIYGGSTATGSLAIQYAVLSGCEVYTTCSPRNAAFVKSLGAKEAFDYNDADCAEKIRAATNDSLRLVFDCISEKASAKICEEAVGSRGGVVSYLLPPPGHARSDVEARHTLAYTVTGEAFTYGPEGKKEFAASAEDHDFAAMFFELSGKLVASKQLAVHPPQVGKGGLEGVLEGMEFMREGKVSGVKLVYRIADTPGLK